MDIYIGNIAYIVTNDDLEALFSKFGKVTKVDIVEESHSGQAKGWGFITMENDEDAMRAIDKLNLKSYKGKNLKVNQYRSNSDRKKGPKFGEWRPR